MSKFDTTLFQYFQNIKRQILFTPLNLGGAASSGGGTGGPPGGFLGHLPQTRVTYDTTEASLSGFTSPNPYNSSGVLVNASLVDNLNHIRYRLGTVENLAFSSNVLTIEYNDVVVASGVTILNFEGTIDASSSGPGEVTVVFSGGTGGSADIKAKVSSNDTTSDYLQSKLSAGTNVSIAVINEGGNEQLQITASGGATSDEKAKVSSNDTTTNYLENKITAGTNVSILVLNDGADEQLQISAAASGVDTIRWYSPINYGAIGNGIANDTSAIVNTINAIPSGGGVLYFPPGYRFNTTGGFVLNKPITVKGMGNAQDFDAEYGLSTILCSSSTVSLFEVTSYGCSFEDIFLKNTSVSTPSAGAGIQITSGGDLVTLKNVTSHSFYYGFDIQDGWSWQMDHCFLVNTVKYGVKIQHVGFVDGGDQSIDRCTFWSDSRNSDAGIRYESGGGLKVSNTKIVGSGQSGTHYSYGIDAYIGSSVSTVILLVGNSSIEKVDVNGIRVVSSASSASIFKSVILHDLEFALENNGSASAAIYVAAQSPGVMDDVIIDNIVAYDWSSSITDEAIYIDGVNHVRIGKRIIDGFGGEYATPNCTDVVIEGSGNDVLAKVSSDDTTANYLESKVVAGNNVTITVLNPGGNEQLRISSTASGSGIANPSNRILARYTLSGTQTFATGDEAITQFPILDYDTHSAVTTGASWKFTAPQDGYYDIRVKYSFNSRSWGTTTYCELYTYKNGTTYPEDFLVDLDQRYGNGQTIIMSVNGSTTLYLASGEYFHPMVYQNSGGNAVGWTGVRPDFYGYICITSI